MYLLLSAFVGWFETIPSRLKTHICISNSPVLQVFSQHTVLSFSFLEHVLSVLNQVPLNQGSQDRAEFSSHGPDHIENDISQAAIVSLTAFFRLVE